MEIKIAVCDDEHHQAEYNKMLAGKWAKENNIGAAVDMFDSSERLKTALRENNKYDILLLDIEMSEQNGVELAREVRRSDIDTAIIFITGYADYMADGYDVSALHYLMKPVDEDKFFEVLDRAFKNLKKDKEYIAITVNREDIFIPLRDIVYIESSLHYVIIHTEAEQYKAKMPLSEIENKLGGGFFKCTRSFIAGLRYVRRISKNEVMLSGGVVLPLGRGLYKDINKAFIKYF